MAMKKGANKVDQNQIAKMFKAGSSAEDISKALLIDVKVVEAFKPKAAAEKAAAEKAAAEKAAAEKAAAEKAADKK